MSAPAAIARELAARVPQPAFTKEIANYPGVMKRGFRHVRYKIIAHIRYMAGPAGSPPCDEIVAPSRARAVRTSVACAAGILIFRFDPATTWWFPSCPLHALSGWLCPFCGSLRAIHALLLGAPVVALSLNPLTTMGAVAGLAACLHDEVGRAGATQCARLAAFCFSRRGLALVIAFGVLRNLPAAPGWMGH